MGQQNKACLYALNPEDARRAMKAVIRFKHNDYIESIILKKKTRHAFQIKPEF